MCNKICGIGVEVFKVLGCHKMESIWDRDMSDGGDVMKKKFV
jgi:hypothetical protein